MLRFRSLILLALVVAPVGSHAAVAAVAASDLPDGFRATAQQRLARGVHHMQLERSRPDISANVAHIGPRADVELRTVSSFDRVAGPRPRLERTSSMCARLDCLIAVNGDFFRQELPVGAVAFDGEFLRSPNHKHHQLVVTPAGRLRAGSLEWSGKIVATDLSELSLDGVNTARGANDLVLYTSAFGRSTMTNPHGVELVVRFVAPRSGRLPIGHTAVIRALRYRHGAGDTKIPPDGAVLSAHGTSAQALGALWKSIQAGRAGREALLRVETSPRAHTVIGGTPVLLRDGKVWFSNDANAFVRSRHPRTIVGWNRRGDVWLVTIDGRQPGHSAGATLAEAAAFLQRLGATDAMNLDGGGSTTFVVRGRVVNRPSDRAVLGSGNARITSTAAIGARAVNVERPVANALVVVPKGGSETVAPAPPGLSGAVPTVETLALRAPSAEDDPGSNPEAALPAVVAIVAPAPPDRGTAFVLAGMLHALVVASLLRVRRRRTAVG